MPPLLTPSERLDRARGLLAEARSIRLPAAGQARGHLVVHINSLLNHATRYARPIAATTTTSRNRTATPGQRAEAQRLLAAIEAARPELLDNIRRRRRRA